MYEVWTLTEAFSLDMKIVLENNLTRITSGNICGVSESRLCLFNYFFLSSVMIFYVFATILDFYRGNRRINLNFCYKCRMYFGLIFFSFYSLITLLEVLNFWTIYFRYILMRLITYCWTCLISGCLAFPMSHIYIRIRNGRF